MTSWRCFGETTARRISPCLDACWLPPPCFNTEAAAQVAHAISVHSITVEDDYFTAVDDLNRAEDGAGAAHLGETEFAAGLFYLYLCIDKELLIGNLSGNNAPGRQDAGRVD